MATAIYGGEPSTTSLPQPKLSPHQSLIALDFSQAAPTNI
jgi:hypothetical protein